MYLFMFAPLFLSLSCMALMVADDIALTFDDVLLEPNYSTLLPAETHLQTRLTKNITLNIPVVSAAMDTVTESRLAIALAQEGGIGIIHKNMSIEAQAAHVAAVKNFEGGIIRNPITISPDTTIKELLAITKAHTISGVPVVDDNYHVVGIVTARDIRFAKNLDQPVSAIMIQQDKLITAHENTSQEEIIALLHKHRIEKVLIVDDEFHLLGLATVKDIQKAQEKPHACKDALGRLRVGAAVGTDTTSKERVVALIEAGIDVIVVDTAHGHSKKVIDMVIWIKNNFNAVEVIAGNIATPEAARALIAAGADAVKVGIGPGSICTTRIVTGCGVPQITAIAQIAQVTKEYGIPLIADGGIKFSGDMCKALAAGADAIMIGNMLAGTDESPGELLFYQGHSYKSYRGMGSLAAMKQGSADRYAQQGQSSNKFVPEGVEGRVPYRGKLQDVIQQLMGGLRSCLGYLGCSTIQELHQNAKFIRISNASLKESHVHDIIMTAEAPNYHVSNFN